MKVLILEDEQPALQRMIELLQLYDKLIVIEATFDSVKDIVAWLRENLHPDLIFMDIQVADGLCFDVFSQVKLQSPVIFTTAYQEYAIKAFKVNSIDYLLKPVDISELKMAMEKFNMLYQAKSGFPVLHDEIIHNVRKMLEKPYKSRFVIKVGDHLRSVPADEIQFFFSHDKATKICTSENRILIIDYSLDHLMEIIDRERFFRINRQVIINRDAIADIVVYSKSRLRIRLKLPNHDPLFVSRNKVNEFKTWLDS
jgi:DNA-binding LytR/AlgR family response regulator